MAIHKQLLNRAIGIILFAVGTTGTSSYAAETEEIETGRQLYEQNCIFCHQADAIGKPGFAPSLSNKEFLSTASDSFIMSTIRDGRTGTGMPPYGHLGKSDIHAIVSYLRTFEKLPNRSKEINAQPVSYGDARKGELWFEQICATCHGKKGQGYEAGVVGTAIGRPGFLDKASDGFIRVTIKEGRSNTRMLGFSGPDGLANLRDHEINDIIAYMRTLNQ